MGRFSRRWFLALAVLGFILGIGLAVVETSLLSNAKPQPNQAAIAQPAETLPAPSVTPPAPLHPETVALVERTGLTDPPRGDVRLVVISDLNSAYGSTDYDPEIDIAMKLVPFWNPDLVLCSGDMVAGQSLDLSPTQIQAMWAAFDQHIPAPLREMQIPFGFTIGNHDASGARDGGGFVFQQERDLASAYWNDPAHDPGLRFVDRYEFPFYYTFEANDIFFLSWDGSTSSIPDDKLAWVEQALASEKAQQAKMRVLIGHLPLYGIAVGRDEPGEVMANADSLRSLLERYNVHTYISGHQHAYYPAHRGNLQLLHTGALGSGPRQIIDTNLAPRKTLTVVDVNFDTPDLTTYTTYDMQQFTQIDMAELPRFLVAHNGLVLRRDVNESDLSAAEKAQCEQRLSADKCAA